MDREQLRTAEIREENSLANQGLAYLPNEGVVVDLDVNVDGGFWESLEYIPQQGDVLVLPALTHKFCMDSSWSAWTYTHTQACKHYI